MKTVKDALIIVGSGICAGTFIVGTVIVVLDALPRLNFNTILTFFFLIGVSSFILGVFFEDIFHE